MHMYMQYTHVPDMGIAVKLRGRTQIVAPIDADRAALNYGDLQWFVITEMRSRMQIHFDQLQIPEDPDDERTGLTVVGSFIASFFK